ncbi:MAG: hypothetical protein H6Q70_513 [Firmicutes bacterium]|nr:hypothetical protein [Bacillota bacterium]
MIELKTATVYYGQDPYIINDSEWSDYQKQGFTKRPARSKDDEAEAKAAAEAANGK